MGKLRIRIACRNLKAFSHDTRYKCVTISQTGAVDVALAHVCYVWQDKDVFCTVYHSRTKNAVAKDLRSSVFATSTTAPRVGVVKYESPCIYVYLLEPRPCATRDCVLLGITMATSKPKGRRIGKRVFDSLERCISKQSWNSELHRTCAMYNQTGGKLQVTRHLDMEWLTLIQQFNFAAISVRCSEFLAIRMIP